MLFCQLSCWEGVAGSIVAVGYGKDCHKAVPRMVDWILQKKNQGTLGTLNNLVVPRQGM